MICSRYYKDFVEKMMFGRAIQYFYTGKTINELKNTDFSEFPFII